MCMDCAHLIDDEADGFRCLAYPGGIPDEIFYGEIDHTKPYKGDNGIVFKPIEGAQDD